MSATSKKQELTPTQLCPSHVTVQSFYSTNHQPTYINQKSNYIKYHITRKTSAINSLQRITTYSSKQHLSSRHKQPIKHGIVKSTSVSHKQ
eukprot:gene3217-2199_t